MQLSMNLPHFEILISYSPDDRQYCAKVLQVKNCIGFGWSYAAALAAAEYCLFKYMQRSDATLIKHIPETLELKQGAQFKVAQQLRNKYGKLSNSELCARFGGGCKLEAFNSALAGNGSRSVRVRIALVLQTAPSELWPNRALMSRYRDDEEYRQHMLKTIAK